MPLEIRKMIVLSGLFFLGVNMKRIICMILTISILQFSVFGYYVQASSTDTSSSYNISEKQKKLYDGLYGSGNWFIDEDGTVAPVKDYNKTRDQMRTILDRFLMKLVVSTGVLGPYGDMLDMLDDLVGNQDVNNSDNLSPQANNYLNKWFSQYNDAIDVDEQGNVSVGADAMQGFRSALSDQVYSLGSYRLLQQNATKKQIVDFLATYSQMGALKLSDMFDSPDTFGVFSYKSSATVRYATAVIFDSQIATEQFYIRNYNFSEKSGFYFRIYDYDSKSCISAKFAEYRSDGVILDSTCSSCNVQNRVSDLYYYGLPIKIFASDDSAKYYYKSLRSPDYQPNVYIYNNYSPSNTTINLNNVNNYDYEKIINNAYNTINNEKNTTIKLSGSISDNDLQLIIKNAIDLAINQTGGGSGGGSGGDGGDSGGGSGGSSGIDYTGILNSILTYCKNISAVVTSSDSRLELLVGIASENKTLISGISTSITDLGTSLGDLGISVKNIEQYLKDISDQIKDLLGDNDSGGESLFDRIIDFLFRTLSNLLADLLGDVIKTIIGDLDGVTGSAKVLAGTAQSKFPTSIPWDIIAIIDIMSADPQCPKFELPFKISRLGIDESITIDLQKAEKVAELSRNMLTVTFLLFLVIQTRKLYGSMTKN